MSLDNLPIVIEPDELEPLLGSSGLQVIDLCNKTSYLQYHIPGAVHMEYPCLVYHCKPTLGVLPDDGDLEKILSGMGISADTHVVAYDDEGGGKAARLLYTLDVLGHTRYSLLNGGLQAWANENHPLDNLLTFPQRARFSAQRTGAGIADHDYIISHLDHDDVVLMDVRTPDEYNGIKRLSARGGHIPGAIHYEWTRAHDRDNNLRLRPADELRATFESLGITPDKEIITYCQSHHRSAHTYILMKWLGYEQVRGYPGAWSDWGNRPDTPVE